jgi:GntR family transcriptional repressor for pyruvate dehydrogenase complex
MLSGRVNREGLMAEPKRTSFGQIGRAAPLHLKIAALISREIDRGQFKPGDKLPTEHELASQFDVSRNVIREAIACLRSDGFIDSRQGIGAFVLEPKDRQTIRIDGSDLQKAQNVRGLFELRAIIEIESAALAAARRSEAQLEAVRSALDDMNGEKKWSAAGIDADLEFHRRVAAATSNDYIVTFLSFISQNMRETIRQARVNHALEAIVEATITEHVAIFEAIAAKDALAARLAMKTHIDKAASRLGIDL